MIVRDFQAIIGQEAKRQHQELEGRLPDYLVACVGGGSNAAGLFYPFIEDQGVRIVGVEAAGHGVETDQHSATLSKGRPGTLHGMHTYVLQDDDGQTSPVHSVSLWKVTGRVDYVSATDDEALAAFQLLCETEGIIPALESAHAVAHLAKLAPSLRPDQTIVLNLSGRGDKDCVEVARLLGRNV
jgi:tryptophan synthase beta chain